MEWKSEVIRKTVKAIINIVLINILKIIIKVMDYKVVLNTLGIKIKLTGISNDISKGSEYLLRRHYDI